MRRPRRGAAHQAGVAGLRHDGDAVVVAELHDLGGLLDGGRPHHDGRGADPRAAPVGDERLLALLVQDQALVADDGAQAAPGRRASPAWSGCCGGMTVSGMFPRVCGSLAAAGLTPSSAAARRSRSLIARPNPVCGMGMTAMRPMSGRSSARRWANRLAAASPRSPAGLRLSVTPGAGERLRAERQQAFVGGDGRRARAAPAGPARSGSASWPGDLRGGVARRAGRRSARSGRSPPRSPRAWRRRAAAGSACAVVRSSTVDSTPTAHGPPSRIIVTAIAQQFGDMLGAGRADGAAAIGRRRGDRPAGGADQRLRHRMRRRADRHGVEPGRRQQRDRQSPSRAAARA